MRIKSVRALAIDVGFQRQSLQINRIASPMSRWPAFAEKRATWMWPTKKTFVRIEDEDGNVGWSCTNGGEITELIINNQLSRLVTGEISQNISDLWDRMYFSLLPNDRSGFAMMAISGIDIALWDLKTKQLAVPLIDILGNQAPASIPTYATVTKPQSHSDRSWWGLKAAMPYAPADGDEGFIGNLEHMRRFREAAGNSGNIMLDAFMAWDSEYTLRFAEAANALDIYWIEDPLPPNDLEGLEHIRVKAGSDIRLALGNFCFNRWDCKTLLDAGLVDVLQPDVAWAGGITECLRILELAEAAGVPVFLHNTCEQPWAIALAATRQRDPVIEFVDRGETSELYGLMGKAPVWSNGAALVERSRRGNQPPKHISEKI